MTNTSTNTSFSKILPNLQLAWDSVSRGALLTCPRYYQLTIINGYTTKSENIHFTFGIGTHGAYETYHRQRAQGQDHKAALISAVRFVLEYTWDTRRNRVWVSTEPTKTFETLLRTVIWYLEQFKDDILKTFIRQDGTPAVELSFHFPTGVNACTNEPYIFAGHLDRFVTWADDYYITDTKTTKFSLTKATQEFFNRYTLDDQMTGYYFAGKVIFDKPIKGLIIDACQTAVTFSRFQRGETHRTKAQLDEWFQNTHYWLRQNEQYAKDNFWPMNLKSCNNYGGCPFNIVCGETPEFRGKILSDFFVQRTWDPLITREV